MHTNRTTYEGKALGPKLVSLGRIGYIKQDEPYTIECFGGTFLVDGDDWYEIRDERPE